MEIAVIEFVKLHRRGWHSYGPQQFRGVLWLVLGDHKILNILMRIPAGTHKDTMSVTPTALYGKVFCMGSKTSFTVDSVLQRFHAINKVINTVWLESCFGIGHVNPCR
jgi:hypothetical protein